MAFHRRVSCRLFFFGLLGFLVAAPPPEQVLAAPAAGGHLRRTLLLSINDTYRIEGALSGQVGGFARVRTLRQELEREAPELLVLHAGDLFFPSLVSRVFKGEQMVDGLNRLDGSESFDPRLFLTFGNHEFDKDKCADAAIVQKRIAESQFTWVSSNVSFKACQPGSPPIAGSNLVRWHITESGGFRVGVFGLTLDDKVPAYADVHPFIEAARAATAELRAAGAEVVVALTHLEMKQDQAMLQELGEAGPDVVLGGHEHSALREQVRGRWICKADSDAGSACVVELLEEAPGKISIRLRENRSLVGSAVTPDPNLVAVAQGWLARHSERFCSQQTPPLPVSCLDEIVGRTQTLLEAEETKIRSQETAVGNFAADLMLAELAGRGAQVALVNAGSLRLNRDVAAGSKLTRRDIEELFEYPTPLRLVRIDGATLQAIVERAVKSWPGHGSWLQIAGFAYRHDTKNGAVRDLSLLTPQGPRLVKPDEEILAVTTDFLVNPKVGNRDGYVMLWPCLVEADGPDLKALTLRALAAAGDSGIAPRIEGRICTSGDRGPCLAYSKDAAHR